MSARREQLFFVHVLFDFVDATLPNCRHGEVEGAVMNFCTIDILITICFFVRVQRIFAQRMRITKKERK